MKRLIVAASVLFLAACGHAPYIGNVTKKEFIAAHIYTWVQYICTGYTKDGMCIINMPIIHDDPVPDEWRITIKNKDDEGYYSVAQYVYDRLEIGSYYDCECK